MLEFVQPVLIRHIHRWVFCQNWEITQKGIAGAISYDRHLVLPENIAGGEKVLGFIGREISPDSYLNLMDQYRPYYRANPRPPLDRPITADEFRAAKALAEKFAFAASTADWRETPPLNLAVVEPRGNSKRRSPLACLLRNCLSITLKKEGDDGNFRHVNPTCSRGAEKTGIGNGAE